MPPHEEILPGCAIEHTNFKKHVDESGPVRDMVVRHDEQIITLFKDTTDNKDAICAIAEKIDASTKKTQDTVLAGVLAVIVAVVATLLWTGRYIEKVERLDRIHQVEQNK